MTNTAKIIHLYGYNAEKGNMKNDVIFMDGEIYEVADFNPLNFDITGQEAKQMQLAESRIQKGEETEGWEPGHVTAQIDIVEW